MAPGPAAPLRASARFLSVTSLVSLQSIFMARPSLSRPSICPIRAPPAVTTHPTARAFCGTLSRRPLAVCTRGGAGGVGLP